MTDFTAATRELVHSRMCLLPVDEQRVEAAQQIFDKLFLALTPHGEVCGIRRGESEPDVGLVRKSHQSGGDEKWFFHVANDMELYLQPEQRQQLESFRADIVALCEFKNYLLDLIECLAESLDYELRCSLNQSLANDIRQCYARRAYSAHTLRGLLYEDSEFQTGAKAHCDRSLLTGHLGDQGGHLLAKPNGVWETVSPPPGKMLVFASAKMLWRTHGQVEPLQHKSITTPGEDRKAMVLFAQADVGSPLGTSKELIEEFWRRERRKRLQ